MRKIDKSTITQHILDSVVSIIFILPIIMLNINDVNFIRNTMFYIRIYLLP